ncbi:hypothetical protein V5O48_015729 [Marasmius crinis-equi]|uniref:Post-SET domain-containing protein n=1 Tax=Marasmius crinis-equi TaxID=585013 RepID=A0ABR3ETP1_9AGAR
MPHLSSDCHGNERCLDAFSSKLSTLEPAELHPTENFAHLTTKEEGLLAIAAHACEGLCRRPVCSSSPIRKRHSLQLVVEDDAVMVLNEDYGLDGCTCHEVTYRVPKSLGWNIWLERLHRWEDMLSSSEYRSPSPDLPPLDKLFARTIPSKRAAEDIDDSDSNESGFSSPPPPPAKRMRTGPCADVVRKIAAKKAAAVAHAVEDAED